MVPPNSKPSAVYSVETGELLVTNLIVTNLDKKIVDALERRAAINGRSVEAEHRDILEKTLLGLTRKSFVEVISTMPNVGCDGDFERNEGREEVK